MKTETVAMLPRYLIKQVIREISLADGTYGKGRRHKCLACGRFAQPGLRICTYCVEAAGSSLHRAQHVKAVVQMIEDKHSGLGAMQTQQIARAVLTRFFAHTAPPTKTGCRLWLRGKDKDGYGEFWVLGRKHRAHRFAYILKTGRAPGRWQVRHTCDTQPCVEERHLLRGTGAQNRQDAIDRDRVAFGSRSGRVRFTAADVRKMRAMRASGNFTYQAIANHFRAYRGQVWLIINRWQWRRT